MKLYVYSSDFLTFVEAKWVLAKFVTGGILLGIVLLFGVVRLNHSVENALGTRPANALTAENDVLRQQISLITPRVSALEAKADQLRDRANKLQKILGRRKLVRDTTESVTNVNTGLKLQSLIASSRRPLP